MLCGYNALLYTRQLIESKIEEIAMCLWNNDGFEEMEKKWTTTGNCSIRALSRLLVIFLRLDILGFVQPSRTLGGRGKAKTRAARRVRKHLQAPRGRAHQARTSTRWA